MTRTPCQCIEVLYLNDTDDDGLLIFLDMEKAFDRVNWGYLHGALRALNVPDELREWVGILYDEHRTPQRRVMVNGHILATSSPSDAVTRKAAHSHQYCSYS